MSRSGSGDDGIYQKGGSLAFLYLVPLSSRDGCVVIGKSNRSQPSVLLFATRGDRQEQEGRRRKGTGKSPLNTSMSPTFLASSRYLVLSKSFR